MLCELKDVRSFLQKPDAETQQDTEIKALCEVVGPVISAYCQREFEPPDPVTQSRTFEYRGGGLLSLAPYDLRELEGVRIDVDQAEPTTLTAEEFRLPYPLPQGVAGYLKLDPYLVHSRSRWQQRLVEVTGKWGFAEVPKDVKQAAVITVAIWLRRDVAAFSTTFNVEEQHLERPEAIPAAAARMLAPYRRQAYV